MISWKKGHFNSEGSPLTEQIKQQTHYILISLGNTEEEH